MHMGVSDSPKKNLSPPKKTNKCEKNSVSKTSNTSYTEDYGHKSTLRTLISDFSAANKRNNPHPKETFLSWRIPSRFPSVIEGSPLSSISELEQCNVKSISTYQQDFTKESDDLPPISSFMTTTTTNTPPASTTTTTTTSHPLPPDRMVVPNLHSSEMHEAYQTPQATQHLKGNTSRYGCSANYVKAACGVVPTLHPIVNAPNYQTWYANEFGLGTGGKSCGHKRPPTPIYPLHLPPILNDRNQLMGKSAHSRPRKNRKNTSMVSTSPGGPGGFSWLSEWAGPM